MNSSKTPTSIKVAILLALCGAAFVSLQSGCAATATRESTGEFVDDSTITAKVKAAFVKDDTVQAFDVTVETFKGVVQLSGFVDNSTQKHRAAELAAGITGVRDVKNNLVVK